ncbi:unnamed protein product [Effrenium voratum]|uniref:Uncharacterized protein n=1 Tax=Effrenium voratum TaxID=2562239 RepID=A0AA36IMU8_9DINO|nr:unnamed protein product [Effrenium voratum]
MSMAPSALRALTLFLLPLASANSGEVQVTADGKVTRKHEVTGESAGHKESERTPYGSFGSYGSGSSGSWGGGGGGGGFGSNYAVSSGYSSGGGNAYGSNAYGSNAYGMQGAQGGMYGQPVRAGVPGVHTGYMPTETETHMPLSANVELDSDDGVLMNSRRRSDKRREDYDYDDNTVLGMANYIYKGSASKAGAACCPGALRWRCWMLQSQEVPRR